MRRFLLSLAILLTLGASAMAADVATEHLLKFLNARLAEDSRSFADAAHDVLADARNGDAMSQLTLVFLANEADLPGEVADALTDELRTEFLKSRSKVEFEAKNNASPLARYVLWLDEAAKKKERLAHLQKAVGDNNVQALNEYGALMLNEAKAKCRQAGDKLSALYERRVAGKELRDARVQLQRAQRTLEVSRGKAVKLYTRAAERMDANGACNLGICLLYGYGCRKDVNRAIGYLQQAVKEGHPQALCKLGECYQSGLVGQADHEAAASLFKRSADTGCADGLYHYARALLYGRGVKADPKAAIEYLRHAARLGQVEAMNLLAECLMDGVGLEDDEQRDLAAKARRQQEAVAWWYHAAVKLHSPQAMERLGVCLLEGKGIEAETPEAKRRNETAAVYWFYHAAMFYGWGPAMNRMGDCCRRGIGGLQASVEDDHWWKTRARCFQGDRCAKIWLNQHDIHRFDQLNLRAVDSAARPQQ